MNLHVSERNGRQYLAIQKSFRGTDGKPSKKNIKTIGYADLHADQYEDPIAHFKEVARQMTAEEKEKRQMIFSVNMDENLQQGMAGAKNLGYAIPLKIFYQLGLDKFLSGKAQSEGFEYNTVSIMVLLVMTRILMPGSKKSAYDNRNKFFERFDFTLDDVYRSLSHFNAISGEMERYMHESVRAVYGSDTSIVYYDVSNFYFEIKKEDGFRKYGVSKEKRKRPIVQMGLAMDRSGVPLRYELFRGNITDKETFRNVVGDVRKNYGTGRIVVVADMGVITGDNINYLVGPNPDKPKNGYVFSFSVAGGSDLFQKYVLNEKGYVCIDGKPLEPDADFKIKWRATPRQIWVTMNDGKKRKRTVHEKQVVFWSKKYADRARAEREAIIEKAKALVADPQKYTKATSYGAAAYVGNIDYDKETGEVIGRQLYLDEQKIEEQEKLDGYYSIVTSETNMPMAVIVDIYRGMWEIEETFKLTKSDLEARPVYVRSKEQINAHFLACFIALTILRIMQKQTGKQFSSAKIIECLCSIVCLHEFENIFLFGYRSIISDMLCEAFHVDLSKKRLSLASIKNILAMAKS